MHCGLIWHEMQKFLESVEVVDTETSPAARAPPAPRCACVAVGTLTAMQTPQYLPDQRRAQDLPDGQAGPTYGHMDNMGC